MIKYSLQCSQNHVFDEWFLNMAEYDEKQAKNELKCPICGDTLIKKSIMAPSVSTNGSMSSACSMASKNAENKFCGCCSSCPHA